MSTTSEPESTEEPRRPGTRVWDGDRLVGYVDQDGNLVPREQWVDTLIATIVREDRNLLDRLRDA